jgi:hypothetical protein
MFSSAVIQTINSNFSPFQSHFGLVLEVVGQPDLSLSVTFSVCLEII